MFVQHAYEGVIPHEGDDEILASAHVEDPAVYAGALKRLLARHEWFEHTGGDDVGWEKHLEILAGHPEVVGYWTDDEMLEDCFFMLYHGRWQCVRSVRGGISSTEYRETSPYDLIKKIMSTERYIQFLESVTQRLIP